MDFAAMMAACTKLGGMSEGQREAVVDMLKMDSDEQGGIIDYIEHHYVAFKAPSGPVKVRFDGKPEAPKQPTPNGQLSLVGPKRNGIQKKICEMITNHDALTTETITTCLGVLAVQTSDKLGMKNAVGKALSVLKGKGLIELNKDDKKWRLTVDGEHD